VDFTGFFDWKVALETFFFFCLLLVLKNQHVCKQYVAFILRVFLCEKHLDNCEIFTKVLHLNVLACDVAGNCFGDCIDFHVNALLKDNHFCNLFS